MPRRFTVTEKWKDPWFRQLKPSAKLVFLYLCDQCDIAGFWEIDWAQARFHTKLSIRALQGAYEALQGKIESDGRYVHVVNFIKHQKNLPLNPENPVHNAILVIRERHKNMFKDKPLTSPFARGIGIGKGKGNGKGKEYSPKFLAFWSKFKGRWNADKSRYDKGGKADASVEFEKLPGADQDKATAAAHKTGGKFTQDACRWLRGKRWEV